MSLTRYKSYSREDIHNIYSPEANFVPGAGKWGLHGIISIPNTSHDFAFFVTIGSKEAGHEFKEGISNDGILTWQSKPGQMLKHPQIQQLINHNESKNNIHLFLRTNGANRYTYLGKLKYLSHNPRQEKPVQFKWKIIDWEIKNELFAKMGLVLGYVAPVSKLAVSEPKIIRKNQLLKSNTLPNKIRKKKETATGPRIVNVDYIEKAKTSKDIGDKGELLVVQREEERLKNWGIIKKVVHVSKSGDGHGYDIESYDENGEKIFIEVKTTVGDINTPFPISLTEVRVSEEKGDKYFIYRLYNYDKQLNSAEYYEMRGAVKKHFQLDPIGFLASFKIDE